MKLHQLLGAILLLGFSFSATLAKPKQRLKKDNPFLNNTQVAADISVGLPIIFLLHDAANHDISINSKPVDTSAIPNIKLGVVSSLNVPFSERFKIGPEIGMHYGPYVLNIKSHDITIVEHCIRFSWCIKSTIMSTEIPSVSGNLSIGYDMDVFLASSYKQHGNNQDLHDSFLGNKGLYQLLPDLPRVSGSFLMGFGLGFPKGFYLICKIKVPTELFWVDDRISRKKHQTPYQLDTDFIMINRTFTSNILEINVGVDILPLFKN